MHLIKRAIHHFFPRAGKAVRVMQTLMVRRALWQCIKTGEPVDASGKPVPWITCPALDYLSRLDFSKANVLEYGAGQSSLWWAERARSVVAVEARAEWAQKIKSKAPANLRVIGPVAGADYIQEPLQQGKTYEVIVIDGLLRFECAQAALLFLARGGLLILDNSDWQPRLCEWLRTQEMMQIDFHGFGPVNDYTWCTSIFVRGQCALPHLGSRWPNETYGNLEQEI